MESGIENKLDELKRFTIYDLRFTISNGYRDLSEF